MSSRIIALIDMDCFYVQVEERDNPSIIGKPAAVVQYKKFKGGGIIAVNYEARALGVGRHLRGDDAKAICSEIILVRVPETRGKADLTKYRDAGKEVIDVLSEFTPMVERASVDEAYIDLTDLVDAKFNSDSPDLFASIEPQSVISTLNMDCLDANYVMGFESTKAWLDIISTSEIVSMDEIRLALGAEIVGKMRGAVFEKTGFRCSAGIAHNKVLAKLVCGINKPRKQTVLPMQSVRQLWEITKIKKVRNLGGKLGSHLTDVLQCENMSDLEKFTEKELSSNFGSRTASWLYQLVRGYDEEPVNPRQLPKSIGCNKNFYGPEALKTKDKVKFWLNQLSEEIVERIHKDLETNKRKAKTLTLHVSFDEKSLSRSLGLPQYNSERMASEAYTTMEKLYQSLGVLPVTSLGLIASKFEDELDCTNYSKINKYFSTAPCAPLDSSWEPKVIKPKKNLFFKQCTTETNETKSNPKVSTTECPRVSSTILVDEPSHSNTIPKPGPSEASIKTFFTFTKTSPFKSPLKNEFEFASISSPNKTVMETVSERCEICDKLIPLWEVITHKDYHFAKDLQKEINELPPSTSSAPAAPTELTKNTSPKKRVRGGGFGNSSGAKTVKRAKIKNSSVKTKTLEAYFISKSSK